MPFFDVAVRAQLAQSEVMSFTRNQYIAGTQNWAMAQDRYKRLYIANNEGLLVFNGTNWQLYPVPNKTILRSIAFGADGKLYAGAQDELGYYAADKVGRLQFTSLKYLLPAEDQKFTDVWQLEVCGQDVFFRTNTKIFKLNGQKITVYPSSAGWISLHQYQGRALAQDAGAGLLIFENGAWQQLIGKEMLPADVIITDVVPWHQDTSLLSTVKHGLFFLSGNKLTPYPFSTPGFNALQHFTSLSVVDDSSFLAGTYFNGIYHISRNGKVMENIATRSGLPNNTVRCVFTDNTGNAWIGLDNGIAFFACNNAIKHINPPVFNNGAVYNVREYNGDLYFALSTGLQWLPAGTIKDLTMVAAEPKSILSGLTWNVAVINNQLLAGRDDGFWKINNYTATQVTANTGYWTFQPVAGTSPGAMAAGNYLGISFYENENGNWVNKGDAAAFTESSRYVETENNTIWVSHPYRGVYKINPASKSVTLYTSSKGLPADLDNHVFKIKNKILFATTKGIYEYDAVHDAMIRAKEYAGLFGDRPVRYLKDDEKGNIWFVQGKMVGVADYSGASPVIHFIPELRNRILSGFENIYPLNTENILVGSEQGFYHINYEKYRIKIQALKAYLNQVQIIGNRDSIIFGGYGFDQDAKNIPALPYKRNSLRFSFAASAYGPQSGMEFSFWLEGFDTKWSDWASQHEKDYTNLPEGRYYFHVKARNSPSNESEEYVYAFSIAPPWYRSLWAYLFYVLGTAALLVALYKFQNRRHRIKQEQRRLMDQKKFEEEQRQLTYNHQLELEKTEKEVIRLKNENLEADIERKNAELAATAMNLVHKKEFLLKITDDLNKLFKPGKDTVDPAELKKIIRSLGSEEKLGEEWEQFSIHFNSVHSNFLISLKTAFPVLSAHDLKLCAYLRMNLSSKEMARLMNISVRGVEINRYRLRKKLQLQPKEDLFQFLLNLDSNNKTGTQPAQ